jgi:predicted solute-binding protein
MLHGPQQGLFDLDFRTPAGCADQLASGAADIGIVPSFELTRQDLEVISGTGIACHGAVRSILLVSSRPLSDIRTLATDCNSRTSVELARIILDRRYGVRPRFVSHPPDLAAMLRTADAALVIGDPALHIDPTALPYNTYDLGAEWLELSGLPMVFAVWAGRRGVNTPANTAIFRASCEWGLDHIEDIVAAESTNRGFAPDLVREYLTRRIVHILGDSEYAGMDRFLAWSSR